jgi:hypothetical protein
LISIARETVEKPTSPKTKKVVTSILSSVLSKENKVCTRLQLGIQDPNQKKLQVSFFRAKIVQKDGSNKLYKSSSCY